MTMQLFIYTSCQSQNERASLKSQEVKSSSSFQDRLFFIDGQICAWVRALYEDSKGNLWIGSNHYGVIKYDGKELVYMDEEDGIGGRINSIIEDADGTLWFATYGGLTRFDGTSFITYPAPDQYHSEVWSMAIDQGGMMWVGTAEGLYTFEEGVYKKFDLPEVAVNDTTTILAYDRITTLMVGSDGSIWLGKDGFGITIIEGNKIRNITEENGLCDDNIADILEDRNGTIWIGTMYGGICRYNGETFSSLLDDGVINGEEASGLYEDRNGDIWFSVENEGIYKYDCNGYTKFDKDDGMLTLGILSFLRDKDGRFWLGGWGGLFRMENDKFVAVTRDGPW